MAFIRTFTATRTRIDYEGIEAVVAYVIVDMQELLAADKMALYRPYGAAAVEKYGGRYLARGGKTIALEGDWTTERFTILEFETLDKAHAWHTSAEYLAARQMRAGAASIRMLAVEGV
jgi:uncharacterized protein (DUF1330 family)